MSDKEKIQLKNDQKYEFDDISIFDNVMTIQFDKNVDMSSLLEDMSIFDTIIILTRGDSVCGQYDDFNTVYKKDEETNTLKLSNDGSIYVKPVEPEPSEPSEPSEPAKPELSLDEVKEQKIKEISDACNFNIVHGVYMEVDGETELFSYKTEDQSNLLNAVQLAIATQMSMPYHADGGNCRLFTPEEITTLYVKEMTNLTHNQTYTNQLKMYIKSLEDKEEVEKIAYGFELIGQYLETYNMIMTQSALVVQKYLESLKPVLPDDGSESDGNNTEESGATENTEETGTSTPEITDDTVMA